MLLRGQAQSQAQRGLKWQYFLFNPYFCDLRCVKKFQSTSLQMLREYMLAHDFPVGQAHSFSPVKYGGPFLKNRLSMTDRVTNFLKKIYKKE